MPGRAPSPTLVLAARQARAPAEAREEAVLAHCEAVARRALSVSPAMPGNPRAACRGRVRHRPSCPAHAQSGDSLSPPPSRMKQTRLTRAAPSKCRMAGPRRPASPGDASATGGQHGKRRMSGKL